MSMQETQGELRMWHSLMALSLNQAAMTRPYAIALLFSLDQKCVDFLTLYLSRLPGVSVLITVH